MFRRFSVRKHWKSTFSITPCRLTTPLHETPANVHINLILPETRVIALHVGRSFKLSLYRLRKTHVVCSKMRNGRSGPGSSKVIDFGTNRKFVCNFLLFIKSSIKKPWSVLPSFRDIWFIPSLSKLFTLFFVTILTGGMHADVQLL